MSVTLPQSRDEYDEDTHHGQANISADNIVNSTNSEDENEGPLPSHVIIETVQYEDYIKQKNGHEETKYGEMIENEDDDCDSVQWIADDHELSPPTKKPKIYLIQPNNAQAEVIGQSSPQPTVALQLKAQPNQVNKHYITVHLQCPQSDCPNTFPEEQLNRHMWEKHSIGPHRCLLKDCKQSFDNRFILGQHLKQVHSDLTEWHCGKCSSHLTSHKVLSNHNNQLHQFGLFKCSFPSCKFMGEYIKKMYNHYASQHKQTLTCQHCNYRTSSLASLKIHERTHSGIKPYRCKWPISDYAAVRLLGTVEHIRRMHLARNSGSVPTGAQLEPKDYVEVVHHL